MQFFQNYNELRQKILDTIQELSNVRIDTSEYSFINQFVNAISAADDNILFYVSLLLNESNINSALLPESIVQIAKTLGVSIDAPIPAAATVQLKVQLNLDESAEYLFDDTFLLKSKIDDTIVYKLRTQYYVIYDSLSRKSYVYDVNTNYPIPSYLSYDPDVNKYDLVFNAEIIQVSKEIIKFISGSAISHYDLKLKKSVYDYDYHVTVNDIAYSKVHTIYQLTQHTFTSSTFTDISRLYFSTDFSGEIINKNSNIIIDRYLTLGAKGNVLANTLVVKNNVSELNTKLQPIVHILHADITNGKDPDDLLTFKNKIFNVFLSRNTILSKPYDLQNISTYLPDVKYSKSILKRSIIPDFTIFVDLTVNDNIINTNSITVLNITEHNVNQDNIYYNLLDNNSYKYNESSDCAYNGETQNNTAICPFELKYSPDLKQIQYYFLHKFAAISIDTTNLKKSSYDNITTASINIINSHYDRTDKSRTLYFKAFLDINTPNLNVLNNSDIFKITFDLYDASCNTCVGSYNNADGAVTITIDEDSGIINIEFNDSLSIIKPEIKYFFKIKIEYYDEIISNLKSTHVEFYTKMGITSSVKIREEHKTYRTALALDNSPTYTAGGTTNLTPYLLYSKADIIFKPDRISVHVYKTSQNQADYSFTNITSIKFQLNDITLNLTPSNSTDDTLDFNINYNVDLDNGHYEIRFTLDDGSTYIHYDFHKINLELIEMSLDYDAFHVPVIRYDDYTNIIEKSVPNSPYLRLQSIYDILSDYVILGSQHNIKFIKTFGRLINIKYNSSFKYANEYIDVVKIPLDLKIDVVVSNEFNPNTDAEKIRNIILDYQNSQTSVESNVKSSLIESKVVNSVSSIYSIDIKQPNFDIIYDLSETAITKNYNYYTPELIRIQSISLNYITSYTK